MITEKVSTLKRNSKRVRISIKIRRFFRELEPGIKMLVLPNRFFIEFFCKFCLKTYFPLKIINQEKIPKDSSFILVSNHSSHIDTGVLGAVSGVPFNRLAMLAAKDYWFENKIRRFLIYFFFNLIPIERKIKKSQIANHRVSLVKTIQFCRNFIAQEKSAIIIYPEGARTRNGEMKNFKDGASNLAIRLDLPIVPVYIKGTYKALSCHDWIPTPQRLLAVVGDPIYVDKNHAHLDNKEFIHLCKELSQKSQSTIKELQEKYA